MTDKEIEEKYYDYIEKGYIKIELVTEEDWDEYYRNLFCGITPSVPVMESAIKEADKRRQFLAERRARIEEERKRTGRPMKSIVF